LERKARTKDLVTCDRVPAGGRHAGGRTRAERSEKPKLGW